MHPYAIHSGCPTPSGCFFITASFVCSVSFSKKAFDISVPHTAGDMELTRIFRADNSIAIHFTPLIIAALLLEYASLAASPFIPATDAINIKLPPLSEKNFFLVIRLHYARF